ncbi:MAG: flagellar motor protein MotA [Gammaproteobacteria bacterium]|nr:flagellar motor protein MotA [Gammaproteobacteria bacterium]
MFSSNNLFTIIQKHIARLFVSSSPVLLLAALSMLTVSTAGAEQQETSLELAFQKEFAFLEAQKQELDERLIRQKHDAAAETSRLQAELDAEEQHLLGLESGTQRLNDLLLESERAIELNEANRDTLSATFEQAQAALADYGYASTNTVGDPANDDKNELDTLAGFYAQASQASMDLARIRITPGDFYLQDGTRTEGRIIHVGNIASYGVSPQGAGVLVPAGGGAMKLWGEGNEGIAKALLAGKSPDVLRLFLYETANTAVEDQSEKTPLDVIDSGGIIGWVIVGLGGIAVLLILLRSLFLRAAGASTGALLGPVGEFIANGKREDALALCKKNRGSTARVLADTVRNLDRDRDHLEDIISESILHESNTLNRFGSFIMVIAAVSPLLGLLGTVTGMIATFDVITEFGTGDPKLLSGGISTALVTTELGLIIAIPALIFGNLLSGWSNRIKDEMEKAALHITNLSQGVTPDQQPATSAAT